MFNDKLGVSLSNINLIYNILLFVLTILGITFSIIGICNLKIKKCGKSLATVGLGLSIGILITTIINNF